MTKTFYTSVVKKCEDLTGYEIDFWKNIQSQNVSLQHAFLSFSFCNTVSTVHPFVRICVIREKSKIVCFFPFQYRDHFHHRFKIAERVAGGMSDYFGLIALPGFVINIKHLCRLCDVNYLYYTHLDQSQIVYGFPAEVPEKGLLIKIGRNSDDYFKKLRKENRKLINDTERRQRRLENDFGGLKFKFNVELSQRNEVLNRLIIMKREQYSRTGVSDSLSSLWKRNLLLELVKLEDEHCKAICSNLFAGTTWVASHFGLQCKSKLHYWFPVYNSELAKYSPGRILTKYVITHAGMQLPGITSIDRGAGMTKAKTDFANAEHLYHKGTLYQNNLVGLGYNVFKALSWRLHEKFGRSI